MPRLFAAVLIAMLLAYIGRAIVIYATTGLTSVNLIEAFPGMGLVMAFDDNRFGLTDWRDWLSVFSDVIFTIPATYALVVRFWKEDKEDTAP